ncbi:Bis(5'-nucleosyl)-tetraphosphatase PrpE [asymmetrical] [Stieleria maiorica]|uniref:Bis(5'-nucleosyl)-tetraphosphatase PrpE [asymmetrical] n=1 Tax=Stieleria maiorica TaxID=2795974 RepID=A0A5B9M967_9BACT|nr:metallophosphoesterase [Stieleria maiorica]QEF96145.1 Bis(5'-nucleosyl)-tetraphosphatase PrpE [asymmetrical] [Stieleria maiorica]
MPAYDIIGDIHGHADELKSLLATLGYHRHRAGYRCVDRKLVFVGDFVDRGPAIAEVIEIVRATTDAGDGFAVMGNHEYNAIAYHTAVPGRSDAWFRVHSEKNTRQHQATLDQLSPNEMADAIAWFKRLPVALELDGIRVVHAAWRETQIDLLNHSLESLGRLGVDFLTESERKGSALNEAVEAVLKGPEIALPVGHSIVDNGGHKRNTVRIKWYEDPAGRTYRGYHFGSDDVPDVPMNAETLDGMTGYPEDAPPVFVGHYWLTGRPAPLASNVACTDYSVAKGGKLVAYRWDGEQVLKNENFKWVEG